MAARKRGRHTMTLKPKALRPPSNSGLAPNLRPPTRPHIRIVAPASNAQAARIADGAAALVECGYRVSFGEHAREKHPPYFAATIAARINDLHAAFADPSVDLIMCTRGGYGSNYLLDGLDLELIGRHPKPFFAYSDMTALQTWLVDQLGLVSFHGPMLAADFYRADGVDLPSFAATLAGEPLLYGANQGLRCLRAGSAAGTLYGGCLTLLAASLGTPQAAHTEGKLLFLEDVGARPYQVDRMLRQLKMAGKLDGVTGYIFGEMLDCNSPGAPPELLETAILGVLDDCPGPIAIGLRSGHVSRANLTLPLGLAAELILEEDPTLRLLEPAVLV